MAALIPEFFSLLIFAAIFALLHLHWNRTVRKTNKFPGPPPLPIIGNVLSLLNPQTFLATFTTWKEEYGPRFRIFLGYSSPMVIISSPEDAETILSSQEQVNKGDAYYPGQAFFGDALITAGAKKWRTLRKIIAPTFHFQSLETFLRIQNEYSRNFSASLSHHVVHGNYFDIAPLAGCSTAATIIHTNTGTSAESLGINPGMIVHAADILVKNWWNRLKRPWFKNQFLWKLSHYGKIEAKEMQSINMMLDTGLQKLKKDFAAGKLDSLRELIRASTADDDGVKSYKGKLTLADTLLLRQAEGDKLMTDEEIRYNVTTIIGAGYDTSGLTTSWLLYNLGKHPEYQALIHQELDDVFSDDPERDVTTDDLTKLKFMEACINETLRLFSIVPLIVRKMTADMELSDGAILPKDVDVMIYIYGIHHDPSIYPNPKVFDPSRFLPENEAKRHKFAFIPFSAGPRNCIGWRYAMFQVKTMAVHLLRKYSVTSELEYHQLILLPDIALSPGNGINIALSNRKTV